VFNISFLLTYAFWKPDEPFCIFLAVCAFVLLLIFRFIQLNLKLFPFGLEMTFWKNFGFTFPRLKTVFFTTLILLQISLLWWIPVFIKSPIYSCVAAYVTMITNNVELAERLYTFGCKRNGSSFAVMSTYALVNRGHRRADDPRIDEAIKKVYGESSPEMHERKRLLADFILMTEGHVPRVEQLRNEARAIDPHKYTWQRPYRFLRVSPLDFSDIYDLSKYRESILNWDPSSQYDFSRQGGGSLIGAPVDPQYGCVMMDLPNVSCWPTAMECDGTVSQTLRRYDVEFLHNRNARGKMDSEKFAVALLWLIPLSIFAEVILFFGRKRLFNHLARRWHAELVSERHDMQIRIRSGNALISLELLRKNVDKANAISLKLIDAVTKS